MKEGGVNQVYHEDPVLDGMAKAEAGILDVLTSDIRLTKSVSDKLGQAREMIGQAAHYYRIQTEKKRRAQHKSSGDQKELL